MSDAAADEAPTLEPLADGTGHRVRVRFGKQRRRFRIPTVDVDLATDRAKVLIARRPARRRANGASP